MMIITLTMIIMIMMITGIIVTMMIMMMMLMIIITVKRFAGHDDLATCRTSVVSPEQPVLCIVITCKASTMYSLG